MAKLPQIPVQVGQAQPPDIYLSGIHMDIPQDEKSQNDMMKTGVFCPACNDEMERVSGENVYTCHMCGGVFIYDREGKKVIKTEFGGF